MMYLYVKAVHIIFVVCWMAGLFYVVRLFIYHTEAQQKPEPEKSILSRQFEIMEKKLWNIITTPAMVLTVLAGALMIHLNPQLFFMPWMQVKLAFVTGLLVYHAICRNKIIQMRNGIFSWSSARLRFWNELATIFLVAIVFVVVLRNALSWMWGLAGLVAFAVLIMLAVKLYKRIRERKEP